MMHSNYRNAFMHYKEKLTYSSMIEWCEKHGSYVLASIMSNIESGAILN